MNRFVPPLSRLYANLEFVSKSGSSLGGFSVVKHLYSLEIALYCYKEITRNILDF